MADIREVIEEPANQRDADQKVALEALDQLEAEGTGQIDISVEESAELEETTPENQTTEPDYKAMYEAEKARADKTTERYVASSKQARKLNAENKQLKAEKAKALRAHEITDDELKKKYTDWEDMTVAEQKAIRRAENAEARAAAAEAASSKYDGLDEYNQEIDDWLDLADAEGKYPDVREQSEEFKTFARAKENRGRNLDELAKIFTFDHPKKATTGKKPSTPFGNSNRRNATDAKPKLTPAQEEHLRKTDFREYMRRLEAGELD